MTTQVNKRRSVRFRAEPRAIYVEIRIRADMRELWRRTQDPAEHARWDLRFSQIEYLPRTEPQQPQRFLYRTRIGFGLTIHGVGTTVAQRDDPAGWCSALKFSSGDPRSLIRAGAGYWKYLPTTDGIRFLTRYDYRTRFGLAGRWLDCLVFRPLLGWATAWSFDRLRLWMEKGIDPGRSLRFALLSFVSIWLLAAIVICQFVTTLEPAHPFRSVAWLLAAIGLAWLHNWSSRRAPSARSCLRRPAGDES